jgi:hypothetical protein
MGRFSGVFLRTLLGTVAALGGAVVIGCSSASEQNAANLPPSPLLLVILAQVTDSAGEPFGGVELSWELRADGDTAVVERRGDWVRADGHVAASLYTYGGPVAADFTGQLTLLLNRPPVGPACNAYEDSVFTVAYRRPVGKAQDTLDLGPVHLRARPHPTLAVGDFCGMATDFGFIYLSLRVDSLRDSLFGAWQVDFDATFGSHGGTFASPVYADSSILTLVDTFYPGSPEPPWTLRVPLDSNLTTGAAELIRPDGYAYQGRFRLQSGTFF